jgi:hypothetical protein
MNGNAMAAGVCYDHGDAKEVGHWAHQQILRSAPLAPLVCGRFVVSLPLRSSVQPAGPCWPNMRRRYDDDVPCRHAHQHDQHSVRRFGAARQADSGRVRVSSAGYSGLYLMRATMCGSCWRNGRRTLSLTAARQSSRLHESAAIRLLRLILGDKLRSLCRRQAELIIAISLCGRLNDGRVVTILAVDRLALAVAFVHARVAEVGCHHHDTRGGRRLASTIASSSIRCSSTGGAVGCTRKIAFRRTSSSSCTATSPSG